MTIYVDSYLPVRNRDGRECTCSGTAPGFPQHESWCGLPEPIESGSHCCGWTAGTCEGCPGRKAVA